MKTSAMSPRFVTSGSSHRATSLSSGSIGRRLCGTFFPL
jgi:hypothetical protein